MRGRARSWRWVLGVLGVAVLSSWVALAVVEGQTTSVTVSEYGFELSCPTSVAEGSTLSCTLTNTTDDANDWPVVAILHLSTDADRALVVGAPVDVSFGTLTGSPAIDQDVWWIGDTLVGYSRFDWTGQAPASTADDDSDARTVSIAATDDTAWETAEAFYVTLGPNSSKGVGFLYDNRQKVSVPRSDSESTDATLSSIEVTAGGTVTRLSPPPATRTINVGYQTTELTVKPAATYKPSKIEVTATFGGSQTQSFEVADGEESESVFLAVGDTSVSVSATAENGTSTQAYQLTVTRAALVGSTVTVSTDEFSLVCPSSVGEGETLVCRLTNTSSAGAPWPVVAFLHSSGDASRALIAEDPIIPDSDPTYSRDLSLRDPQTPAVADYNFGYGELFSGGSRSVYTTYGYEKFDWAGSAAAGAYRDVRVDMAADALTEPAETFYVAIAPSGYTGLSSLVENRAPVQLTRSGPRVNGPASPSVAENSTTVATYTAAEFDGGTPVLSLSGTDAGLFSISGGLLSFRSAPDFEAPGGKNTYAVTVTATLADVTASLGVTVAVTNLNDEDPVVSGLASVTVAENSTTVATYSATDPDGVTTFTWSLKDADDDDLFAIDTSAGVLAFGSAPDFDDPGDVGGDNVYNVTVEASDSSSPANTGEHAVVVTVTGVDEPPVVSGLDSKSFAENGTGVVASYSAIDPEGAAVSWASLGGVDAALFQLAANGDLSFRSPPDHETRRDVGRDNVYNVTVRASDSSSPANTGEHAVVVTVTGVDEPPVVSGLDSKSFAENGTGVVASYSAIDPEGAAVSWASLGGVDAALFQLAANGDLSFRSPPDHETRRDVGRDNVYNVTVRASDSSSPANTGEHAVVVTVTGVDEPPVVSGLDSKSFAENGTGVVASYSAIDPEGAAVSWASLGGVDAALFQLAANGDLSFRSPPDHETRRDVGRDNVYNVTVRASDSSSPANTGEHAVVVTVTGVDEPPVVSGLDSKSFAENGTEMVAAFTARDPEGQTTLIWSLLGPDRDRFAIDGGRLSFGAPPDYEAAADSGSDNVYNVTVRASDGGETGEHAVAVTVTNVEENGSLELSSPQPQVGTELTATLIDADGVVSETWRWERSPNRSAWTLISEASSGRYTPVTADFGQFLRATVDYTDGYIPDPDKDLVATSGFATQVTPGLNNAPEFASARVARSVLENAAAGDVVGAAVVANDLENNPLVYSLTVTGVDPAPFTIDRLTGQIRVAERATLNHESRPSLTATVTATDPSRASGSVFVDIMIDGVNEAPMTVPDEAVTQEDTAVIVDVRANDSDPEGDDLTVTVSSELRDGTATVEADGTVLYTPGIDYHGTETFAYEVSDGHFEVDGAVSVTVHPVNDAPVFASADTARTVLAGAAANAPVGSPVTASDVDDATLSYTLEGIDASLFDIEEDTGQIIVADGAVLVAADQYTVTVQARDSHGETDRIEVAISVTERVTPPITGGGGGGGPAPPQSAGFTDVDPSGVHATGIEALFAAGITVGCGREPRRFCPDQPVTRAQMATFLARALNLEAPSGSAGFADADPSGVHTANIEALFAAGITVGCGREPRRFCPDQPVTRAQMATFLARALNLEAPSGSAGFADADPSGVHTANIEALFAAGITVGCGREPRRFCSDQPVTRAQMATFLARALNLEAPS